MLSTPKPTRRFRNKKQQAERIGTRKLVCFTWANEQFAIAIESTQHIVKGFTPYGSLENGYSLVRHNHETITLIDFSKIFSTQVNIQPADYLIICTINFQKIGIAVSHLPRILEVAETQFTEIPAIYQQKLQVQAIESLIQTSNGLPVFCLKPAALLEL